jgi:hypothetical protein
MPANLTTFAHFSNTSAMNLPNSLGGIGVGHQREAAFQQPARSRDSAARFWHIASLPGPPANVRSSGSCGSASRALKTRMTAAVIED